MDVEEAEEFIPLNDREAAEVADFHEKILAASKSLPLQIANPDRVAHVPVENRLRMVTHEDRRIAEDKIERIYRDLDKMTLKELQTELQEINKSHRGSRKDLRWRLRKYYREQLMAMQHRIDTNRSKRKTSDKFRYLVAIDIEATCEQRENDINYQHETIELPAVLVDCQSWQILSDTEISQADVDKAPTFPEAFHLLQLWMERKGLLGGDEMASFAIVTDGPNDVHHFMQRSFLQYGMPVPREFRQFINIKSIFETHVGRLKTKGDGISSISKMCEALELTQEGVAHSGLDDAMNVARIAIALVTQKGLPLYMKAVERALKSGKRLFISTMAADRLCYELLPVTRAEFESGKYLEYPSDEEPMRE